MKKMLKSLFKGEGILISDDENMGVFQAAIHSLLNQRKFLCFILCCR